MRYPLPATFALALAACSSDPAPPADSGPADLGPIQVDVGGDVGAQDRPAPVDGGADAGATDAGTLDSGTDATPVDVRDVSPGELPPIVEDVPDAAAAADAASDVPADNGGACITAAECPTPPNATPRCTAGICRFGCFPDTRGDCDGNAANGCEVDSLTDPRNCGACRNACPAFAPRCVNGACTM